MMKWNAGSAAVALVGWWLLLANVGYAVHGEADDRPAIAAICTYYQPFMHSDVIVSKFLLGFPTDQGIIPPDVRIASLYIDQGPDDSLGHQLARMHDIPVFATIEEARCEVCHAAALSGLGCLIMRLHKHQCLMRLGHPVMRQAMATLCRQLPMVDPLLAPRHHSPRRTPPPWPVSGPLHVRAACRSAGASN
jgi:hypothetical protein